MQIKTIQLQKRASYTFDRIQDKIAIDEKHKIFALADGTTQGFYSEKWAEILTRGFIKNPTFKSEDFKNSIQNYARLFKEHKFKLSENPAIASLEKKKEDKGAAATFLGLQISSIKGKLIAYGDANFFLFRDNEIVSVFPHNNVKDLEQNTRFLITSSLLKEKQDDLPVSIVEVELEDKDTLVLASDALSALIFKIPKVLEELKAIDDFAALHTFCFKHWEDHTLQDDDISAIIIEFKGKNTSTKHIVPPDKFSFPKEPEYIFSSSTSNQHDMDDQLLQRLLNENNSFRWKSERFQEQLSKKARLILIFLIVSLLFNSLIFFLIVFGSNYEKPIQKPAHTEPKIKAKNSPQAHTRQEIKMQASNAIQTSLLQMNDDTTILEKPANKKTILLKDKTINP